MNEFISADGPGRKAGRYLEKSLSRAWSLVSGVLPLPGTGDIDPATRTAVALLKTVLLAEDGALDTEEVAAFRAIFSDQYPASQVNALVDLLESCAPVTAEEALPTLLELPESARLSILRMLMELGQVRPAYQEAQQKLVRALAAGLSLTPEQVAETAKKAEGGRRLLKSGAGILVALIVIGVFVATATFLKSVVFGLILAYVFLPLERFYERCLTRKRNPIYWIFALTDRVLSPLPRLARRIAGREPLAELSCQAKRQKALAGRIGRASSLTVFSAVIFGLVLVGVISELSAKYVVRLGSSMQSLVHEQQAQAVPAVEPESDAAVTAETTTEMTAETTADSEMTTEVTATSGAPLAGLEQAMARLNSDLELLKVRFQKLPLVQMMIGEISNFLHREDASRVVMSFILRKTVGIFSFTADFFSWLAAALLDVLLTIFFFSLFLSKIATAAAARSEGSQDRKYSGYLVRTVFNGKWLPGAKEDTLNDAEGIISQVIYKLRVWLRGYLILMSIDFTVYSTVFYFLGVPYWPVLGAIAACGILLPFIGPVAAAVLTVLVTLAVYGSAVSGLQILGIVGIFLWHNGIVEQFFLYPLVIGDALGLTTMETIIVVLLGGIFAGITGMIFALPAAAIIKYLVPQIYNRWK